MKEKLKHFVLILAGSLIYALAVKLFLLPGNLITGGTTGIALAVSYFFQIDLSLFVLIFNIIMLIVGYALISKEFALSTILSTISYPIFLKILDVLIGDYYFTSDVILCTIFAGIGIGAAIGLVVRAGGSTGGMDIPPLVLYKYFKWPISVTLYVFDFLIVVAQCFYQSAENVLYGIVLIMIYTIVLDKLTIIGNSKTELKIISDRQEEIKEKILSQMDRGVTMLKGKGGYMGDDKEIILTVISNREVLKLQKLVQSIDPECFIIINRVSEVKGKGFSMQKEYK